jgi:hypothetical protein
MFTVNNAPVTSLWSLPGGVTGASPVDGFEVG